MITKAEKNFQEERPAPARRILVQRAFGSSWPAGNRGETNGQSKLTEADVIEIRERHARGEGVSALAREFKICPGNVCAIVQGRSWKHLLPGFEYASRHRHCLERRIRFLRKYVNAITR